MTDVQPLTVTLGDTTTISGSGDLSKAVTGGTLTLGMTGVGGAQLVNPKKCKGDGCHPDDLGHAKIASVVATALSLSPAQ